MKLVGGGRMIGGMALWPPSGGVFSWGNFLCASMIVMAVVSDNHVYFIMDVLSRK